MTRHTEKSKAGREAKRLSDGLFRRGVLVGGQHADPARDSETGSRVRNAQAAETKGRWTNRLSIENNATSAKRRRR